LYGSSSPVSVFCTLVFLDASLLWLCCFSQWLSWECMFDRMIYLEYMLKKYSVCFQWMFWGYSLAYSRTASPFIGDMANFGLKNVMAAPSPGSALLPEIVFCLYQMLFCACTVQLVIGGSFERGRILPSMIFAFCWATIVYCPIACWTWNVSTPYKFQTTVLCTDLVY
jgi:ammonia channel protein AmtB